MNIEKLYEILMEDKPSELINDNEEYIFSLIPELKICKGFKQNNPWHIYDVYEHILHVVDETPIDLSLRLVALFHDIGKPSTYTEDENSIGHFYNHWSVSKDIFLDFCKRNDINDLDTHRIANLINYHDIKIDDELLLSFDKDFINDLFSIKRADLLGQNSKYHYLLSNYETQKEKIISSKKYYVNK